MRALIRPLAAVAALALTAAAQAAPALGSHYRLVDPPVPSGAKPGQVEVIEFFSIGCGACAAFEPSLQSWLKRKPADVAFSRVPATFSPPFKMWAKVYYALEDLGAAERLVPLLFSAVHTQRDPALLKPYAEWQTALQRDAAAAPAAEQRMLAAVGAFVAARGVDAKRFDAALRSPSVALRLGRGEASARRFGMIGVPALGVGGRYFTNAGRPFAHRDGTEMIGTLDHLVQLARAPR